LASPVATCTAHHGDGDGLRLSVSDDVALCVGVGVGLSGGVGVSDDVGDGDGLGAGVGVGLSVGAGVELSDDVGVRLCDGSGSMAWRGTEPSSSGLPVRSLAGIGRGNDWTPPSSLKHGSIGWLVRAYPSTSR
jgi:hypothetical protein